ncbi:hypothetical protein QDR37_05980 [Amnibacterium sp. CER49]|uniref:hypothetical protein n=1 Tax=Amnibacterium sp. CER49 TaxID=3039161 RepID=UPI00244C700F|nr:hypothetical protein [Amnibacterium sp. CER49]MDH2443489.1 hypothetical protein [Amnibacterium sp. CER49]
MRDGLFSREPRAWAATRARGVVLVGAVAAVTGALAPQHAGQGWRSAVLATLGVAVVLFGAGWLVALRRSTRTLLAGRVLLGLAAAAAAAAGVTETALGSLPFGVGLVAVAIAVAVFAALLPRFLAQVD